MGDMTSEGSNLSAGIDLSQFYQVFFEEAAELDHDDKKLLACGSILDDETFKSFVVFDNWVALLL
jgi:two-component system chemotaxis sensor kinase CheA